MGSSLNGKFKRDFLKGSIKYKFNEYQIMFSNNLSKKKRGGGIARIHRLL